MRPSDFGKLPLSCGASWIIKKPVGLLMSSSVCLGKPWTTLATPNGGTMPQGLSRVRTGEKAVFQRFLSKRSAIFIQPVLVLQGRSRKPPRQCVHACCRKRFRGHSPQISGISRGSLDKFWKTAWTTCVCLLSKLISGSFMRRILCRPESP